MYKVLLTEKEYKKLKHIRHINESETSVFKQVPSSFAKLVNDGREKLGCSYSFTKEEIENELGRGSFMELKKGEAIVEYNLRNLTKYMSKCIGAADRLYILDNGDGYFWKDLPRLDSKVISKLEDIVKEFAIAMGKGLGFENAELNVEYDDDDYDTCTVIVRWDLEGNYPFYDNGDGTYEFNL